MTNEAMNPRCVMIAGESISGKTASLKYLKNHPGVMFLNCEAGKDTPFKNKFQEGVVTHPDQVPAAFEQAEDMPEIHTIVVDSLTYLMDMHESKVVLTSTNTMKAWSDFAQYLKHLMQHHVALSTKNVIFTAHVLKTLNEQTMEYETSIPVKGQLKNNGIESFFNTVVYTKKMSLKKLEKYSNDMLNITEDDEIVGYKHVFQTRPTKETVNDRIRGSMGLWSVQETFIDNNAQLLLDHINEFYK